MKLKNISLNLLSSSFALLFGAVLLTGCATDAPSDEPNVIDPDAGPSDGNPPVTTPGTKPAATSFTVSLNQKRDAFTYKHYVFRQPEVHGKSTKLTITQHVDVVIPEGTNVATAPVYFILEGQRDATLERLLQATNLPRFFGAKYVLIAAEHRGYGQSISDDQDQSVPKYVTADNAVDDAHAVITALKAEFKGPWIASGAGYAGSLAMELGATFPKDAKVIVASSGLVRYPAQDDAFEGFVRQTFGGAVFTKLATTMAGLKPTATFDATWQNRETLEEAFSGLTEYAANQAYLPLIAPLADKSAADLLTGVMNIDKSSEATQAFDYGIARSLRKVTRTDMMGKDLSSRVFFYQQCAQFGGFHVSPTQNGIFTRSLADAQNECGLMFGVNNVAKLKVGEVLWSPEDNLDAYGAADSPKLVYIRGAKDPNQSRGLAAPNWQARTKNEKAVVYDTSFGVFVNVPSGLRSPDLDDGQVAFAVWTEIMNVIAPPAPANP